MERQTLELPVLQLQKDKLFIPNILANQNTGDSQKPFSIDPLSAAKKSSPSTLETHEPSKAPAPLHVLMGSSDPPTSFALSSSSDQCSLSPDRSLKASKKFRRDQLE